MKSILTRLTILATLCVLLITCSMAADSPAPWAQEAVDYAITNQIMDETNLRPLENGTRAELATMITRLFGQTEMADLSQYTDMAPDQWYYEPMAKAVSMGIIQGSGTALTPDGTLTREQAMVILARAYGIYGQTDDALDQFTDQNKVSAWARNTIAALVDQGYVNGRGDTLAPQGTITRQELAQLLYNMAETYTFFPEDTTRLANKKIEGNLVICGNYPDPITLVNVDLTGNLILHGNVSVSVKSTCDMNEIITCGANVDVTTTSSDVLTVLAGSTTVTGGLEDLTVYGNATVATRTVKNATLYGGALTVSEDATVTAVTLAGKNSVVDGEGTVKEAQILKKNCQVLTQDTVITEEIDPCLEGVKLVVTKGANDVTPSASTSTTTVSFQNVVGEKTCTLLWYVDNVLQWETTDFLLKEGATATFSTDVTYTVDMSASKSIAVYVQCDGEYMTQNQYIDTHLELSPYRVETLEVLATINYDTVLYQDCYLTRSTGRVLAKGTQVVYDDYILGSTGRVVLDDGTVGWVNYYALTISNKDFVRYTDYTQYQKEHYVNSSNYSSTSDYMVWVSLKTQKVNIFTGSQGDWSLLKTFSCCSGKNTTPTEAGVFAYQYLSYIWDFGAYYVKNAMVFNGGHAFHTRTYIKGSTALLDPTIGTPKSHGCIRMYDADVQWMVDYLPFKTTVVVY